MPAQLAFPSQPPSNLSLNSNNNNHRPTNALEILLDSNAEPAKEVLKCNFVITCLESVDFHTLDGKTGEFACTGTPNPRRRRNVSENGAVGEIYHVCAVVISEIDILFDLGNLAKESWIWNGHGAEEYHGSQSITRPSYALQLLSFSLFGLLNWRVMP